MTQAAVVMGLPIDVDPLDALLQCVRIAAGEVQYATMRVAALTEAEAVITYREETEGYSRELGEQHSTKTSTAAELHIWIRARQSGLERLAKFSKMAIDAGIAERQVQIAEQMGTVIGRLIQAILTDLMLTPAQETRAPMVVRQHLTMLEGGA